jgi:hypothetical protein
MGGFLSTPPAPGVAGFNLYNVFVAIVGAVINLVFYRLMAGAGASLRREIFTVALPPETELERGSTA